MAASIGGGHLQLKKQLIGWKGFSKWQLPYGGCHLQSKEQFWLVEPVAILEEPFASFSSTLNLETPPRHLRDRRWKRCGGATETRRRTLTAPQVIHGLELWLAFWSNTFSLARMRIQRQFQLAEIYRTTKVHVVIVAYRERWKNFNNECVHQRTLLEKVKHTLYFK